MLKRFGCLIIAIAAGYGASASAQTAAISFNNNSAQLGYGFLVDGTTYARMEFRTDFLYSKDKTYMLSPGIMLTDDVGSKVKGLRGGLGGKLYGASVRDTDTGEDAKFLALSVGGMLRYSLPVNPRVFLGVDGYISPNILSFDADLFYEAGVKVGFEALATASVFLEYRRFYVNTEKGSVAFDDGSTAFESGVRFGMELTF